MAEDIATVVVKLLLASGLLALVAWVALKVLAFLRELLRPARKAVRTVVARVESAVSNHVADSLDCSGMPGQARAARDDPNRAARFEGAIGRALDAVSDGRLALRTTRSRC